MDVLNRNYVTSCRWLIVIIIFIILHFSYNISINYMNNTTDRFNTNVKHWCNDCTTYKSFMAMKDELKNFEQDELPIYSNNIPVCVLNISTLGPVDANYTELNLEWVEQQYPEVQSGGLYAPAHCRSRYRVAILISFRDREANLAIFLYHIHRFLKKQLLEYRIFVIEQYGTEKFNKGILYNIGFLESQRFGTWDCHIFHDVDLIPMNEKILYSCPRLPTHMSSAIDKYGYELPYEQLFGGVTALTPKQFTAVNGYSNCYWNWGAEDDDMFIRLQARRFPITRYNRSIARYAALSHIPSNRNGNRYSCLLRVKRRFRKEGLLSVVYRLIAISKRRLFTHILADVNPLNRKT